MMMNEEKTNLLKLVFDRENDIFFWQYKACEQLGFSDERLFEMLNELAMYTFIKFDSYKSEMRYVDNLCMTLNGLDYLHEQGLISYFEYRLRVEYLLRGQHEV